MVKRVKSPLEPFHDFIPNIFEGVHEDLCNLTERKRQVADLDFRELDVNFEQFEINFEYEPEYDLEVELEVFTFDPHSAAVDFTNAQLVTRHDLLVDLSRLEVNVG